MTLDMDNSRESLIVIITLTLHPQRLYPAVRNDE